MLIWLLTACSQPPCSVALPTDSSLVQIFERLEQDKCTHPQDVETLKTRMDEYHRQTTLHCDQVYRRSSIDGLTFDGPEELVLHHASVADVVIDKQGRHIIVYNDTDPQKLVSTVQKSPIALWERGLIGFGGLGLAVDLMNGNSITTLSPNLHLDKPLELVDPDIGLTPSGQWRLSFFAVAPSEMDSVQFGPMAAPKPHKFYRTASNSLTDFPTPSVMIASSEGSTGGADPAVVSKQDGSEILYVGPLDHTTMGWISEDGNKWDTTSAPDFNTRMRFATPDAVMDPQGFIRLYGMTNGRPGQFEASLSKDGIHFQPPQTVLREKGAFNVSVGLDPVGVWWIYYNKTDQECLNQWGSKKILPFGEPKL